MSLTATQAYQQALADGVGPMKRMKAVLDTFKFDNENKLTQQDRRLIRIAQVYRHKKSRKYFSKALQYLIDRTIEGKLEALDEMEIRKFLPLITEHNPPAEELAILTGQIINLCPQGRPSVILAALAGTPHEKLAHDTMWHIITNTEESQNFYSVSMRAAGLTARYRDDPSISKRPQQALWGSSEEEMARLLVRLEILNIQNADNNAPKDSGLRIQISKTASQCDPMSCVACLLHQEMISRDIMKPVIRDLRGRHRKQWEEAIKWLDWCCDALVNEDKLNKISLIGMILESHGLLEPAQQSAQ